MVETYTTLGSTITVQSSPSINAVGFSNATAIVGGFDPTNGSATANEVKNVSSVNEAEDYFGVGSELTRQVRAAISNPVGTIYCVGVSPTQNTESFSATTSGTLSNAPIFEPSLADNYSLTATNTTDGIDCTVEISYEDPIPSPTTSDTVVINPITGAWEGDSSTTYEITYQYGNYGDALTEAASLNVRTVSALTEAPSITSIGQNELSTRARNIDFKRLFVGARPSIDVGEIGTYEPSTDDWRVVEVAPSRGFLPDGDEVRTVGAVGSLAAAQPINVDGSITYDSISGLDSLNTSYLATDAKNFERVTALTEDFDIASGVTTSTEAAFTDIYACEIIDLITANVSRVLKQYRGGGNLEGDRGDLSADLKTLLRGYSTSRPPALGTGSGGTPYTVNVSKGAADSTASVVIGIDPAPIMKTIDLDMNVGDVVTFDGATAN